MSKNHNEILKETKEEVGHKASKEAAIILVFLVAVAGMILFFIEAASTMPQSQPYTYTATVVNIDEELQLIQVRYHDEEFETDPIIYRYQWIKPKKLTTEIGDELDLTLSRSRYLPSFFGIFRSEDLGWVEWQNKNSILMSNRIDLD